MPKFYVTLLRDGEERREFTEACTVIVEAENAEEAEKCAVNNMLKKGEQDRYNWADEKYDVMDRSVEKQLSLGQTVSAHYLMKADYVTEKPTPPPGPSPAA